MYAVTTRGASGPGASPCQGGGSLRCQSCVGMAPEATAPPVRGNLEPSSRSPGRRLPCAPTPWGGSPPALAGELGSRLPRLPDHLLEIERGGTLARGEPHERTRELL